MRWLTLLVIILAGCATSTVRDVTATAPLVQYESSKAPREMAACALHALDAQSYPLGVQTINNLRDLPGEFEIVQQGSAGGLVLFVANVKAHNAGSSLRGFMSPVTVATFGLCCVNGYREAYIAAMNSCR